MSTTNIELLSKEFLQPYKTKQVPWGYNGLGYIVYKRTYARVKPDGTTEEWWETIERCINGAQKIGAKYTTQEAEKLFDHIFNLRCNFAGRMLWQLGTPTVDKFGANSLLNCWFVSIRDIEDFCFIFENLMLGGGVGFSVKREDIHELPKVVKSDVKIVHECTKDADFIVSDKREGWVELLRKVLTSYFFTGKSFTYSTLLVRGRGEDIKGFGGKASGPSILIDGIGKICQILQRRQGKKIRSIDALDIANIIGSIVVAGNVRRSAEIAIGDPDDHLFIRAKNWSLGDIPNWRSMSNNSIYADSYDHISSDVWKGYDGSGEPYGFINIELARKIGRLGHKLKDNCEGFNPCAEIPLSSHESCNLAELYLNNIRSQEELNECAMLLYKTQKAINALPFIHEETNEVVHKNMRIGLGVTGVCQCTDEQLSWLDPCYNTLREFDKQWSALNNWPESIRLTTAKPSGTLSLLSGSTPGVHPSYAKYYIRRVRLSSDDPLLTYCRKLGCKTEYLINFDGTLDRNTSVVEFPCQSGDNVKLAKDMTAIDQLELVKKIQTLWADNAVSVTVYYKPEELSSIRAWMRDNYKDSIKSVSFLLHSEHGFKQAPYEEITKDRFELLQALLNPVVPITSNSSELLDGIECVGGVCPVR